MEFKDFWEGFGWGTWIRTRTNGVRVRGSTVNLFPKTAPAFGAYDKTRSVKDRLAARSRFWAAFYPPPRNSQALYADFCTRDNSINHLPRRARKSRGNVPYARAAADPAQPAAIFLRLALLVIAQGAANLLPT